MHKYTSFLLAFLVVVLILLAPSILRADILSPEPEPYTFENQQKLSLSVETGGEPLGSEILSAGSVRDVRYSLWFNESFLREYGDITPGHEADVFQAALEDDLVFLELWRGEPFTAEATVVNRWELPAAANGNVTMTFPEPGEYFVVAYMTNEIRDEAAYCARYEVPQEYCEEDGYFVHFAPEDTQRYFIGDFGTDVGLYDSNPIAFGGARFSVGAPLGNVSNVLFLPGIKGTRLYRPGSGCDGSVQSCARKLWEPFGNDEVRELYLDEEGRSVNRDVYVRAGDILSSVVLQDLYTGFFADLDEAETNGTFGAGWHWEAAAYDWRLSLDDIVSRGARYDDRIYYEEASGTPYIEQLLRDLASSSPTGKVTIIAHSNGGLVAKDLMTELGDEETARLIDALVFVGVPQSGAPQALAAALFGYGEALPFDRCANTVARLLCSLLVDRPTARSFAESAPMGYHLLPSKAYFDAIRDNGYPFIRFSGSGFYLKEQARYGLMVDTADELYDFALARDEGREKPAPEDTGSANVLSENLISYARHIHETIDGWTPPAGVDVYQIGGWGKDTLSGIEFYEEPSIFGLFGGDEPLYRPYFVEDGDGVVPIQSAHLMQDVHTFWIDLVRAGKSHASLLEIPDVRALVNDILVGHEEDLPLISESKPNRPPSRRTMLFLHSPLTLGIRDADGTYTGLNEDGSVAQELPDIEYGQLGEVKYLIVPREEEYELVMRGTGKGTFTLEMLEYVGNDVATTSSIVNVPVTGSTVATMDVPAMTRLRVDTDGDGTADIEIIPRLGEPLVYGPSDIPAESEPVATTTDPVPEPASPAEEYGSANGNETIDEFVPAPETFMETEVVPAQEESPASTTDTTEERKMVEEKPTIRTQTASALDAYTNAFGPTFRPWWLLLLILPIFLLAGRKKERQENRA